MKTLLFVGLGGSVGAIARYAISDFIRSKLPSHPHAGTLVANILGCLLIGVVLEYAVEEQALSRSTRLFVVTGCLGALTTFSTFGYETIALLESRRLGEALVNVLANVVLGLSAVWLGIRLVEWLR